jgi:two-component system, sensor histidine kinase and response regulator
MKVLVVEDDGVIRELLRQWITKAGHEITIVETGVEGARMAIESRFDLIFMDLWLDDIDGDEVARRIRIAEAGTGRRVPIIAISGHSPKEKEARCLEAGMDGYLAKPVTKQHVMDTLKRFGGSPGPAPSPPENPLLQEWDVSDREILPKLVPMLVSSTEETMRDIEAAIQIRDAARIRRLAHSMKGPLGMFHAKEAVATTRWLEDAAKDEKWTTVLEAHAALQKVLPVTFAEIQTRADAC